jgi:phenylacetic acid degradation operon negative regulatory protein
VTPSAKRFVLQLLSAADDHELPAAKLVAAGEVLGMTGNRVRVAVARLVAARTLEATGRGSYRLGAATRAVTRHVTAWRDLERQMRRWDGAWAFVHVGELPRSDRAALVKRQRALRLLGFRPLGRTLEVRPDNLQGGVPVLRERLTELGVERTALLARVTDLDPATEARARKLWDAERLDTSYLRTTAQIDRWIATLDLEPRTAAREAFLFGGDVLRKIIFDPRLPEPLVDVDARRAMLAAAGRLDAVGRRLWSRLSGVPMAVTREDSSVAA